MSGHVGHPHGAGRDKYPAPNCVLMQVWIMLGSDPEFRLELSAAGVFGIFAAALRVSGAEVDDLQGWLLSNPSIAGGAQASWP